MRTGGFLELCIRRGLKVNTDKNNEMVLGRKEELVCEFDMERNILKLRVKLDRL